MIAVTRRTCTSRWTVAPDRGIFSTSNGSVQYKGTFVSQAIGHPVNSTSVLNTHTNALPHNRQTQLIVWTEHVSGMQTDHGLEIMVRMAILPPMEYHVAVVGK